MSALSGQVADPLALLLEYAIGGSLASRLRLTATDLPFTEVRRIAAMLFEAVCHVHAHDLVHRDVKPSNLLFTGTGALRLSDFGVAAHIGSAGTLEYWEEERIGTLGYAAPEQLVKPATSTYPTTDVYGVGAVLYELLTGHLPFELLDGESECDLRQRIIEGAPVPLLDYRQEIDPAIERVVLRALEADRDRRFVDVSDLARAWNEVAD